MEISVDYLFAKIGKMQVELEVASSRINEQDKQIAELKKAAEEAADKPAKKTKLKSVPDGSETAIGS